MGFLWEFIATMVRHYKFCPGCHFNKPYNSSRLKFHQEFECPALSKYGYVCKKDVTETDTILDEFNEKFSKAQDQPRTNQTTGERRTTEEVGTEHASARRICWLPMPQETLSPVWPHDSVPKPAPPETQTPHLLNQAAPAPSYKGYADLYLSDPDNAPVFEEMVGDEVNKPINPISKYDVSPPVVVLKIIPYKVLKKRRKTICQR